MSSHTDDKSGSGCARWDIPKIDELLPTVGGTGNRALAQPGSRSYDEGFARGREDALLAGRQELQAQVTILQRLMQSLAEPFAELDEDVETALLELSTAIAKQIVRRELATDPQLVLSIIREAVSQLPVAERKVNLQLHPEDAQLLRENMPAPIEEGLWRLVEDVSCERGGCNVTTDHARIDASLDQQIERIAVNVLGVAGEEPGRA